MTGPSLRGGTHRLDRQNSIIRREATRGSCRAGLMRVYRSYSPIAPTGRSFQTMGIGGGNGICVRPSVDGCSTSIRFEGALTHNSCYPMLLLPHRICYSSWMTSTRDGEAYDDGNEAGVGGDRWGAVSVQCAGGKAAHSGGVSNGCRRSRRSRLPCPNSGRCSDESKPGVDRRSGHSCRPITTHTAENPPPCPRGTLSHHE